METSEPPWGVVVLAFVTACALANRDAAIPAHTPVWGCPVKDAGVESSRNATLPVDPVAATASVCIYCTGVGPADGVYATIYLTIDARVAIADLRIASLELTDAHGAIVAHGAVPEYVGIVTERRTDLGAFSGQLATGAHVVLWTGSRLDVGDQALRPLPIRYRLHLVAHGSNVIVVGALEPPGATA